MAKFSFHCQCYKKESLLGINKHNLRKNKHYGNKDIDTKRSVNNRIYISPDSTLYQACKKQIEERVLAKGGRVTKASNWICECIFSYPEELPKDRIDEYYGLILEYMASRLGRDNMVEAVVHMDEGGVPHMHLDILTITKDGRLSSKELISKSFIISVHDELPKVLQSHGFSVERGSGGNISAGLDAKEYKKRMDIEASSLDKRIDFLVQEYNKLVEAYNKLVSIKKALEKRNYEKACEIIRNHQRAR